MENLIKYIYDCRGQTNATLNAILDTTMLHSMLRPFGRDVIRGCNAMQHVATTMQQNEDVHFVASLL